MDKDKISANKQKKVDEVKNLTEKINKSTSIIFTDFRGLTHIKLEELRRILHKNDAQIQIVKNRLFKRAMGNKASGLSDILTDSTAVMFCYGDQVIPVKELVKYFKAANVGKAKGGFMKENVLSADDVKKLSGLPSKLELLAKLVGQMNAPIQNLHYGLSWNLNRLAWALNSIKNSKSN